MERYGISTAGRKSLHTLVPSSRGSTGESGSFASVPGAHTAALSQMKTHGGRINRYWRRYLDGGTGHDPAVGGKASVGLHGYLQRGRAGDFVLVAVPTILYFFVSPQARPGTLSLP